MVLQRLQVVMSVWVPMDLQRPKFWASSASVCVHVYAVLQRELEGIWAEDAWGTPWGDPWVDPWGDPLGDPWGSWGALGDPWGTLGGPLEDPRRTFFFQLTRDSRISSVRETEKRPNLAVICSVLH